MGGNLNMSHSRDYENEHDSERNGMIFERVWKNSRTNPPKECDRYWCLIEEQNDLGKSHFQWNCSYNKEENRWSDNHEDYNVIFWTELAPNPIK